MSPAIRLPLALERLAGNVAALGRDRFEDHSLLASKNAAQRPRHSSAFYNASFMDSYLAQEAVMSLLLLESTESLLAGGVHLSSLLSFLSTTLTQPLLICARIG